MDDALDKLQKIRNEVNALNPSDDNAHRLELSIREAIRLIRKAEKIDKAFREKCVQDLDYEITHYLHQNYRKAVTKGEKTLNSTGPARAPCWPSTAPFTACSMENSLF